MDMTNHTRTFHQDKSNMNNSKTCMASLNSTSSHSILNTINTDSKSQVNNRCLHLNILNSRNHYLKDHSTWCSINNHQFRDSRNSRCLLNTNSKCTLKLVNSCSKDNCQLVNKWANSMLNSPTLCLNMVKFNQLWLRGKCQTCMVIRKIRFNNSLKCHRIFSNILRWTIHNILNTVNTALKLLLLSKHSLHIIKVLKTSNTFKINLMLILRSLKMFRNLFKRKVRKRRNQTQQRKLQIKKRIRNLNLWLKFHQVRKSIMRTLKTFNLMMFSCLFIMHL